MYELLSDHFIEVFRAGGPAPALLKARRFLRRAGAGPARRENVRAGAGPNLNF